MTDLKKDLREKKEKERKSWKQIWADLSNLGLRSSFSKFKNWLYLDFDLSEKEFRIIRNYLRRKPCNQENLVALLDGVVLDALQFQHTQIPGVFIRVPYKVSSGGEWDLCGIGISREGRIFRVLQRDKETVIWEGNLPPEPYVVKSFNMVDYNILVNALTKLGWVLL